MLVRKPAAPTNPVCGVTNCTRRLGDIDIATFEAEAQGHEWTTVDLRALGIEPFLRCPPCQQEAVAR